MSKLFNASMLANQGLFGAQDGGELTEETTPAPAAPDAGTTDATTTVVVNDPAGAAPNDVGNVIPPEAPSPLETDGDITIITDPDDDEVADISDCDDDDDSADLIGGVDMLHASVTSIGDRCEAIEAIETNGVDPLTIGMLMRHGLLTETALGGMSSESFTDTFVGSQDSVMSQEALANMAVDAAKAMTGAGKAAAGDVGAAILKKFTSVGALVSKAVKGAETSTLSSLDRVIHVASDGTATIKAAGGKTTKDAIGAVTEKVAGKLTAKNAALAISAAVAVAGGLKLLLSSVPAPTATAEAKTGFFQKVVNWVRSIKLPWAKLDVTTGEAGEAAGKLTVNGKTVKSATAAAEQAAAKLFTSGPLGWTKDAAQTMRNQVAGLSEKVGGTFSSLGGKFNSLMGAGENAGKAASAQISKAGGGSALSKAAGVFAHGSYVAGVVAILALIASVVYFVVVGGLRLVRKSAQG